LDYFDELVEAAVRDFRTVASLASVETSDSQFDVEIRRKPHAPPSSLPLGKMAVYAFFYDGQALKVGKAGPKSAARYTYQHYSPTSAPSTLARSIMQKPCTIGLATLDADNVGQWIRTNTDRINILLPLALGLTILSLLEAFLHVRWKPKFEGRLATE
jgi:hypothetical protein